MACIVCGGPTDGATRFCDECRHGLPEQPAATDVPEQHKPGMFGIVFAVVILIFTFGWIAIGNFMNNGPERGTYAIVPGFAFLGAMIFRRAGRSLLAGAAAGIAFSLLLIAGR